MARLDRDAMARYLSFERGLVVGLTCMFGISCEMPEQHCFRRQALAADLGQRVTSLVAFVPPDSLDVSFSRLQPHRDIGIGMHS